MIEFKELYNYINSNKNKYINHREYEFLLTKYKTNYEHLIKRHFLYNILYFKYIFLYKNLDIKIKKHNRKYINYELKTNNLLNNINNYKLDNAQKEAVLSDEVNTLVIAGAGSGKSLTIIGKIIYLVEDKKFNPKEILCISLTNAACKNLKENLSKCRKINVNIMTFHHLALDIIKQHNSKVSVVQDDELIKIINNYFDNIKDINIIKDLIDYFTIYIDLSMICESKIKTIDNKIVRNKYDYLVSAFLYINCISYTYKYTKDKSIFSISTEKIIIYHNINNYKKIYHIELFDNEFIEGKALKILEKKLREKQIKINKRNLLEILDNINEYTLYINQLKKLIETFINLFKSSNYDYKYFENIRYYINKITDSRERNRQLIFIRITEIIYSTYEYNLTQKNKIDFNDMINLATKYIKKYDIKNTYKYIIIDEYQDTSITKYTLIKELINKTKSNLMVVGDDFQSIYGFTGCNLDIFVNFEKYYGYTNKIFITNTYRNSKELIDIAGKFIMKNPYQIKKELNSIKHKEKPINYIYYNNNFNEKLEEIIEGIDNNKPIMLLGRNNFDVYKITQNNNFKLDNNKIIYIKDQTKNIYFMTVHKSKGLEEENVIIINTLDSVLGFPNKMQDDIVLKYVKNKKEYYLYEEERRLFYVALTRTKNNLYIMIDTSSVSLFVKELLKIKK